MIPTHRLSRPGVLRSLVALTLTLQLASDCSTRAASKGLDLARQLNEAFVEVSESVSRSVVVIEVEIRPELPDAGSEANPWLDKLPDWFRRELIPDENGDSEEAPAPRQRSNRSPQLIPGQGSGVIIREDGYILTNAHVVKDAQDIKVRLKDGRQFDAEVRGIDDLSEVAVIKLKGEGLKDLPVATFADSEKVRVGEFAIAIGTPYALDYSVTIGHVSAKGRGNVVPIYMNGGNMDQDFIQTDANINPGNSGGPLVNLDGEVIGINTMIRGIGTGIGFAVPSNLARTVSTQLIDKGSYERAWLGVGVQELSDFPDHDMLAPGRKDGLVVKYIPAGAPASKSELKPSDVIVAINGKAVKDTRDLRFQVRSYPLGTVLTLDVVRGGSELKIKVETGTLPEETLARSSISLRPKESESVSEKTPLGIKVEDNNSSLAKRFGLKQKTGVVVTEVDEDGPAAARGIRAGMVITDLNHHSVKSLEDYEKQLSRADLEKGVLLNFTDPDGSSRFQVLKKE